MEQSKISGGDQDSENILLIRTVQREEKNKIIFEENQKGFLQPHGKTHRGMMERVKNDFYSISVYFFRHHVEFPSQTVRVD